jgi:ATP-dependent DNA helicase RecQ
LYYVAMTRARKTLTLCANSSSRHVFIRDLAELCFKSHAALYSPNPRLALRTWVADPKQVILSWPGYFSKDKPLHQALAKLEYGDALQLRVRSDGKPGWELLDMNGIVVGRMAQAFRPPNGEIIAVKVGAILARKGKVGEENLRCAEWEVVLPVIEYLAIGNIV